MLSQFSWLERGYVNLTLSDDDPDCDVAEIRALLDDATDKTEERSC